MKNIYLIGFMGTGKSAVGRSLAKHLRLQFLDLDSLIEKKEAKPIRDIFAKDGEAYFRRLEKDAVKEVSGQDSLVVACGGGVILDKDNIALLKKSGILICLTSRPEIILKRCRGYTQRPLLNVENPKAKIQELLDLRAPFYSQAHFSIDTSDRSIQEVVEDIISKLNSR